MLQNQNGYVMIFPSLLFASVSSVASSAAFQQTKLQRRIWRVSLLQQGTCAYFISVALSSEWVLNNALHSALDVPVFKWPWEASDVRGVTEGNVISIQSQSGSGWKKASVLQLWSNQISFIITTVTVARCETIKHRKRKDLSELKAVAHNGNLYNSWFFFFTFELLQQCDEWITQGLCYVLLWQPHPQIWHPCDIQIHFLCFVCYKKNPIIKMKPTSAERADEVRI